MIFSLLQEKVFALKFQALPRKYYSKSHQLLDYLFYAQYWKYTFLWLLAKESLFFSVMLQLWCWKGCQSKLQILNLENIVWEGILFCWNHFTRWCFWELWKFCSFRFQFPFVGFRKNMGTFVNILVFITCVCARTWICTACMIWENYNMDEPVHSSTCI